MFTWINKQGVRSSQGFEVQFTGRFTAEYREGGRVISVSVEQGLSGGPCISIEGAAFARWDGSASTNSAGEQQRLLANFKEALKFQGLELE